MARFQRTSLERTRSTRTYRHRLATALQQFQYWLASIGIFLHDLLESPREIDQYLCDFINQFHHNGGQFWIAKHAALAITNTFRHLRKQIPRAWDCISSWDAQRKHCNRVPLPLELLKGMFLVALSWAFEQHSPAYVLFSFCVLLRTGFFGLLRTGEILSLRARDICFGTRDGKPVAIIAIGRPKTRHVHGRTQVSIITEHGTVCWLRWLTNGLSPSTCLWPSSRLVFSQTFQCVLTRLSLQRLPITPGCLRPGGASHFLIQGYDTGRLQFLGRWRSLTSLQAYLQEAMSSMCWLQLSASEQSDICVIIQEGEGPWKNSPRLAWPALFSRGRQWSENMRHHIH